MGVLARELDALYSMVREHCGDLLLDVERYQVGVACVIFLL
jgi:hypothetical protein